MSVIKKADVKGYFSERRKKNLPPFGGAGQKLPSASPEARIRETPENSLGPSVSKTDPLAGQK
jgi:hypothetical protein